MASVLPLHVAAEEVLRLSAKTFTHGFITAFSVRALIALLARMAYVARKKPSGLLSFTTLLGEKHVVFRVEASRLGLFVGSFAGGYHLLRLWFRYLHARRSGEEVKRMKDLDRKPSIDTPRARAELFVAGVIAAAVSVSFLSQDLRRTLALYSMARSAQSAVYYAEECGVWRDLLPTFQVPGIGELDVHRVLVKHLDALVFAFSTAQIMYSYVINPHALPAAYWNFIVKTGPIPAPILTAVRHVTKGDYPIPLESLGLTEKQLHPFAKTVPCSVLHPGESKCRNVFFDVLESTTRKSWLMYLSINIFSYAVTGFPRLIQAPVDSVFRAILSSSRSTLFLALYVALYQSTVCFQRKVSAPTPSTIETEKEWRSGF